MPIIVNVKGFGEVEFPDGTSQKEIEDALKKLPKSIIQEENDQAKFQAQLAGAGIGAAYSFGMPTLKKVAGTVGEGFFAKAPPAAPPVAAPTAVAAPAAPSVSTAAPATGGLPSKIITDGGYLPKGSTGSQVYNFAKSLGFTDIEAQNFVQRGMTSSDVYELSKSQRSAGFRTVESIAPTETWRERGSGLMLREQGAGQGPKAQFVQQPIQSAAPSAASTLRQLPPTQPIPEPKISPLEKVSEMYRKMMATPIAQKVGAGAGAALRVAAPPLALASAFGQAHDISSEQGEEEPDRLKQALAAAGLLGTGMMMVPGGQIPGAALAIGAPAIQYAREKFR